jgi:hypothetical protein
MQITGKGGGHVHPIVTIVNVPSVMKTRTHMATINTDPALQTSDNNTEEEIKNEDAIINPTLIKWEEWALSAEEHFHALQKFRDNPRGRPMGHKA